MLILKIPEGISRKVGFDIETDSFEDISTSQIKSISNL